MVTSPNSAFVKSIQSTLSFFKSSNIVSYFSGIFIFLLLLLSRVLTPKGYFIIDLSAFLSDLNTKLWTLIPTFSMTS